MDVAEVTPPANSSQWHNQGVNGRTIADLVAAFYAEVRPLSPYYTEVPGVAFVNIGNNDLGQSHTSDQINSDTAAYVDMLHSVGLYVVLTTIGAASAQPPGSDWDNRRLAVNAERLSNSNADAIYDFAAWYDPDTMSIDGTHPNLAAESRYGQEIVEVASQEFHW